MSQAWQPQSRVPPRLKLDPGQTKFLDAVNQTRTSFSETRLANRQDQQTLRKVKLHTVAAKQSTRHQIVRHPAYRFSALAPQSLNPDQMRDSRRQGLLDNPKLVFYEIQYCEFQLLGGMCSIGRRTKSVGNRNDSSGWLRES